MRRRLHGGRQRGITRRQLLKSAAVAVHASFPAICTVPAIAASPRRATNRDSISLFLCGDVMTGRGIDQIMRRSVQPRLYEPYVTDARHYIALAEGVNGNIPRPVDPAYVWGDALAELEDAAPDLRLINLETAITDRGKPWPRKGIHYRMHPSNVAILRAADIDCCVLANNHTLDWGYEGLTDTLETLHTAGIATAGIGSNETAASEPALLSSASNSRIGVFACASRGSGVPSVWAAAPDRAGMSLLADLSINRIDAIAELIETYRADLDLVVLSIHWGGNWGYAVPPQQQAFARALIDTGMVDVVHGHSSHHPRPIEVYRQRLILYGCGDLINDYEGIGGHESYRGDLSFMYFPTFLAGSRELIKLSMVPMQIRNFRLQRTGSNDRAWLLETMNRIGVPFATRFEQDAHGHLQMRWH